MAKLKLSGFEIEETGGGCTALVQRFPNGHEIVITAQGDPVVPDEDGPFTVGLYVEDGRALSLEYVSDLRESTALNQYGVVNHGRADT